MADNTVLCSHCRKPVRIGKNTDGVDAYVYKYGELDEIPIWHKACAIKLGYKIDPHGWLADYPPRGKDREIALRGNVNESYGICAECGEVLETADDDYGGLCVDCAGRDESYVNESACDECAGTGIIKLGEVKSQCPSCNGAGIHEAALAEGMSNLGRPNIFYRVIKPFRVWWKTGSKPSNAYYGAARINEPTYIDFMAPQGAIIAHIFGGTFISLDGRTARLARPSKYEFEPFGHRDNYETWPLQNLEVVDAPRGINYIMEHIEKIGDKYRLLSHTGKNLGTFDSHAAAAKHEGEVEYFKKHESVDAGKAQTSGEFASAGFPQSEDTGGITTEMSDTAPAVSKLESFAQRQLGEKTAPGQEDWVKANKNRFKKEYGADKGTKVLYATAWKRSER